LEAEFNSFEGRNEDANEGYISAIGLAQSAKFKSEEGLAAELAGFHSKKIGDRNKARSYFDLAKQCYSEWGSQMKVDYIDRHLEMLG